MEVAPSLLDKFCDSLKKGDVLLIESEGGVPPNLLFNFLRRRGAIPLLAVIPKGLPEVKDWNSTDGKLLILGQDVDPDKLYELIRIIRQQPEGTYILVIHLDLLLLKRDEKTVFMFLEDLTNAVQKGSTHLIITVDKRILSPRQMAAFESFSSYIIEITEEITGTQVTYHLRVKRAPKGGTDFYIFDQKNGEIILKRPSL
ncbi:hypothetical protein [Thermococcus sp.]|uniref:hypothetical protein n=1 Tax=Thermococcus sp. TaxID=35749 RepID=UPI00261AEC8C|nr:hypothetical protein [Thermococcus sp.]